MLYFICDMDKYLIFDKPRDIFLTKKDRRANIFINGMPSVGVSTFVYDLIKQEININSAPLIIFDSYGYLCDTILGTLSTLELDKTAYIDLGDENNSPGLNIFNADIKQSEEIANILVNLLFDLYDPFRTGVIGPRFEHAVRNAVSSIMYDDNPDFNKLVNVLTDSEYLNSLIPKIQNPTVKNYWQKQIAQTSDFHKSEILDYIVSKFSKFLGDSRLSKILNQPGTGLNLDFLLKNKKLIIIDFAKLRSDAISFKIVSEVFLYKLVNVIKKIDTRDDFISLYIDDLYDFTASSITQILKEGRLFKLQTTLISTRFADLDEHLRNELLRCGSLVTFRLSSIDANHLTKEFHNKNITIERLSLLKKYHVFIKTLVDGNPAVYEEVNMEKSDLSVKQLESNELNSLKVKMHLDSINNTSESANLYPQE